METEEAHRELFDWATIHDAVFDVGGGRQVVERDFGDWQRPESRRRRGRNAGQQVRKARRASQDLKNNLVEEAHPVHETPPCLKGHRHVHFGGGGLAHRRHSSIPTPTGD
ncbi:hypothetical protein ACFX1Q_010628 [Malus domestica]